MEKTVVVVESDGSGDVCECLPLRSVGSYVAGDGDEAGEGGGRECLMVRS